jgi:hypothetical protein
MKIGHHKMYQNGYRATQLITFQWKCKKFVNILNWGCNIFSFSYFVDNFVRLGLGSPWSRSWGSLIYNYLCNWCLSPLKLWVWIPLMARYTPVCSTNKTDCHFITEILLKHHKKVFFKKQSYQQNMKMRKCYNLNSINKWIRYIWSHTMHSLKSRVGLLSN